jgi:prepilin signal peptidase PulO-like enzyme (type II secretory pathway)
MNTTQAVNWWPLAGVLGLFIGSYLNVVAWRWYRQDQQSPQQLASRSKCPHCSKVLSWKELIPIVSFIVQRGRCVKCKAQLSIRYPLVELAMAIVFSGIVAVYGFQPLSLLILVIASIFIVIALVDSETQLIPDRLSIIALIITILGLVFLCVPNLLQRPILLDLPIFEHGITGALIGIGILGSIVLITKGRGMGIGDIKLAGVLGLSLGGPATLLALFTGFVSGAIVGLILIQGKKASLKTAVPFGPFLVFGWLVAILWSTPIIAWYTGLN